jgi:drug/metabolite transporter (DMT)-like permease
LGFDTGGSVAGVPRHHGWVSQVAERAAPEVAVPARGDLVLIAIAVSAVSTSGPLIAATVAPALAVAFWRNALAAGVLAPAAIVARRAVIRGLSRRESLMIACAGGLLAAHFATWITSLRFTSVASSTALAATQPVWAALIARARGALIDRMAWVGIALAVAAAGLLTGIDAHLSTRAITGDILALIGGMFAAGYVSAGAAARQSIDTITYTSLCYTTTALLLFVTCLAGSQNLTDYQTGDWARIAALTIGAQFLGHSVFNHVLKTTSATVVSLAILLEVPGAALLAAIFLRQPLHLWQAPIAALLLAGLAIVIRSGARAMPAE